jgi:hypothetical protein
MLLPHHMFLTRREMNCERTQDTSSCDKRIDHPPTIRSDWSVFFLKLSLMSAVGFARSGV